MSSIRKVVRQTKHSVERLKQRLGVRTTKEAERMIREASIGGIAPAYLPPMLRAYLEAKAITGKRVRVHRGIVFIFAKCSNRCYTAYQIPEEFREEYEQWRKNI